MEVDPIVKACAILLGLFWICYIHSKKRAAEKAAEERANPKKGVTEHAIRSVIKDSDDYHLWGPQFVEAAIWLLSRNILTFEDLKHNCGWAKAVNKKDTYFIFPKENPTAENRIYLFLPIRNLYHSFNGHTIFLRYKG